MTGASRGIGSAIARSFAAAGARVVLVARGADALGALAGELGHGAQAVVCDVTDPGSVNTMVGEATAALGDVPDIVVNNAGIFEVARIDQMPVELFRRVVDTNLLGPFLVVRGFIEQMRARGSGHFVTLGSIADRSVFPENGAYSPAKFAARAMHQVLRDELRGSGVRATLVSPGPVDTAMWDGIQFGEAERVAPDTASMLSPEAVAEAVLYAVAQPISVNVDELRLSRS